MNGLLHLILTEGQSGTMTGHKYGGIPDYGFVIKAILFVVRAEEEEEAETFQTITF